MPKKIFTTFIFVVALGLFLVGGEGFARSSVSKVPPWVTDLPIPQNEEVFLVVKGTYRNRAQAQKVQKFIQQLMGTTPPDRVDTTDRYSGLPKGKYLVGMIFDSHARAQWWIKFSYRNRKIPKGVIKKVKLVGISKLPYMPEAVRGGKKRLLTKTEALARVKALADIKTLSRRKKLIYKFTDYPRNGDLRYEVEVLESKGKRNPVMVDFIMVSALDGQITERLSFNLRKNILKEH